MRRGNEDDSNKEEENKEAGLWTKEQAARKEESTGKGNYEGSAKER